MWEWQQLLRRRRRKRGSFHAVEAAETAAGDQDAVRTGEDVAVTEQDAADAAAAAEEVEEEEILVEEEPAAEDEDTTTCTACTAGTDPVPTDQFATNRILLSCPASINIT
jgi:hypothetical protein